ncbi:hypothetical protein HK104_004203 [Borealophlyctis nickersoniae]|nr:hypothetical protein HK104_004203 [Borealophlyctis nickersoniae]
MTSPRRNPSLSSSAPAPAAPIRTLSSSPPTANDVSTPIRIQIFPHTEHPHRHHHHYTPFSFPPVEKDLRPNTIVRIGRKVDKRGTISHGKKGDKSHNVAEGAEEIGLGEAMGSEPHHVGSPDGGNSTGASAKQRVDFIAFRSKVVSRTHAELWVDKEGQVANLEANVANEDTDTEEEETGAKSRGTGNGVEGVGGLGVSLEEPEQIARVTATDPDALLSDTEGDPYPSSMDVGSPPLDSVNTLHRGRVRSAAINIPRRGRTLRGDILAEALGDTDTVPPLPTTAPAAVVQPLRLDVPPPVTQPGPAVATDDAYDAAIEELLAELSLDLSDVRRLELREKMKQRMRGNSLQKQSDDTRSAGAAADGTVGGLVGDALESSRGLPWDARKGKGRMVPSGEAAEDVAEQS